MHDESVNLKEVMESLAEEFRFCPVQLTYDMGYDIPKRDQIQLYSHYERGTKIT